MSFELEALPHLAALRRTAHRLTRNACDAEDLAQDVMLRAFRSWSSYTPGTNVRGWLYTILFSAHTDGLRRRMRSVKTVELSGPGPAVPPAQDALHSGHETLLRALRGLPQPFRRALLLRDVRDLSYHEIARALGVPLGTAMSRVHRGRARLRKSLASAA